MHGYTSTPLLLSVILISHYRVVVLTLHPINCVAIWGRFIVALICFPFIPVIAARHLDQTFTPNSSTFKLSPRLKMTSSLTRDTDLVLERVSANVLPVAPSKPRPSPTQPTRHLYISKSSGQPRTTIEPPVRPNRGSSKTSQTADATCVRSQHLHEYSTPAGTPACPPSHPTHTAPCEVTPA